MNLVKIFFQKNYLKIACIDMEMVKNLRENWIFTNMDNYMVTKNYGSKMNTFLSNIRR